jgi:hypothetical protein
MQAHAFLRHNENKTNVHIDIELVRFDRIERNTTKWHCYNLEEKKEQC